MRAREWENLAVVLTSEQDVLQKMLHGGSGDIQGVGSGMLTGMLASSEAPPRRRTPGLGSLSSKKFGCELKYCVSRLEQPSGAALKWRQARENVRCWWHTGDGLMDEGGRRGFQSAVL